MFLFMFLLLFVFLNSLKEDPLSPSLHPRDDDSATSRTTYDIIWSCVVTIFACVWTAGHPNIPAPLDSEWTKFKRRVVMMSYALIAPEMVVLWAWRQYSAAQWIARDYNETFLLRTPAPSPPPQAKLNRFQRAKTWMADSLSNHIQSTKKWWTTLPESAAKRGEPHPWTHIHGFFIQMGGFFYEKIDAPIITDRDIKDRSKGDAISKGFVVLQTTWFTLQCLGRAVQGLPLCQLEVVTLGFAVLNAIVYAVWWNKPQDVDLAICIQLKPLPSEGGGSVHNTPNDQPNAPTHIPQDDPKDVLHVTPPETSTSKETLEGSQESDKGKHPPASRTVEPPSTILQGQTTGPAGGLPEREKPPLGRVRTQLAKERKSFLDSMRNSRNDQLPFRRGGHLLVFGIRILYQCVLFTFRPFAKMTTSDTVPKNATRVPMFYADSHGYSYSRTDKYLGMGSRTDIESQAVTEPQPAEDPHAISNAVSKVDLREDWRAYLGFFCICVLFGTTHLFAWTNTSATPIEHILWRASAVIVTVVPAMIVLGKRLLVTLSLIHRHFRSSNDVVRLPESTHNHAGKLVRLARLMHMAVSALLGVPLYILARFMLLGLALASLRDLPPGVHTTVLWTSFIPHV